jgi:hypothetical protein
VLLAAASVATHFAPLLVLLAYGFIARVVSGPRLSPLGLLVTRVVRPRMGVAPRWVPGPPKRFAQGIGAVVSTAAAILAIGLDQALAADLLLALLGTAAALEAGLGLCLGCRIYALLARAGVVRECADCVDPGRRVPAEAPSQAGS